MAEGLRVYGSRMSKDGQARTGGMSKKCANVHQVGRRRHKDGVHVEVHPQDARVGVDKSCASVWNCCAYMFLIKIKNSLLSFDMNGIGSSF